MKGADFVIVCYKGAHHQLILPLKYMQNPWSLALVLRLLRQYFGYNLYIKRLEFSQILIYVFMYGGSSISFSRYGSLKLAPVIFYPFFGPKTRYCHFTVPRDYFFGTIKISNFVIAKVFYRLRSLVWTQIWHINLIKKCLKGPLYFKNRELLYRK